MPLVIDVTVDPDGCALIRPTGSLDTTTYGQLRDALLKQAVEIPAALLVDLSGLAARSRSPLSVFSAVWLRTADWPGVPLLLYGEPAAGAELLATSGIPRFVGLHPDLETAKRALGEPPIRRRATLSLPWITTASSAARRFVEQTCRRWQVAGDVVDDAESIVTEFVENTLHHTHAEPAIRLELRRGLLTVAVSDTDPGFVEPAVAGIEPGMGFRLVASLSSAWGCTPTRDGGKIVWAVLRAPAE